MVSMLICNMAGEGFQFIADEDSTSLRQHFSHLFIVSFDREHFASQTGTGWDMHHELECKMDLNDGACACSIMRGH